MAEPEGDRAALRRLLVKRRAALSGAEQAAASTAVTERLARLGVLRDASVVSGYRAVRGELDIDAALWELARSGVAVTVPRVDGDCLEFVGWDPDSETAPGAFGIPEPVGGEPVALRCHDVVLAPLVAFDLLGNRLGQGGGYYDRCLAPAGPSRSQVVIGIAHSFQQVDRIPTEPWDRRLDAVVTDREVLEFRPGATLAPSMPAGTGKGPCT